MGKTPKLGARLKAIFDAVTGNTVIDVGSDHGKLAAALAIAGKRVCATDLNPAPLDKSRAAAQRFGVADRIEFYMADGLNLPDSVVASAETVVIAGMGGELIAEIISSSPVTLSGKQLILQPMSREAVLRAFLAENGITVMSESVIAENGKLFLLLDCRAEGMPHTADATEKYIGKLNVADNTSRSYLVKRFDSARRREKGRSLSGKCVEDDEISALEKALEGIK